MQRLIDCDGAVLVCCLMGLTAGQPASIAHAQQPVSTPAVALDPASGAWGDAVTLSGAAVARATGVRAIWYPNDDPTRPAAMSQTVTIRGRPRPDALQLQIPVNPTTAGWSGDFSTGTLRLYLVIPGEVAPVPAAAFRIGAALAPARAVHAPLQLSANPCSQATAIADAFDVMRASITDRYAALAALASTDGARAATLATQRDGLLASLRDFQQVELDYACGGGAGSSQAQAEPPRQAPVAGATPARAPSGAAPRERLGTAAAPPPEPDTHARFCSSATPLGSVTPGAQVSLQGVIEASDRSDWFQLSLLPGTSVDLTVENLVAGGSQMQLEIYGGDCTASLTAATSGPGPKTVPLTDSAPRSVNVRVFGSPWDGAQPGYRLTLRGR